VVGAGLGGDTARQDCEGSRPRSDRLLIKPAAMVTRPVPAARGHFEPKARPRRPVTKGPLALPAPASMHQRQESNQPACHRTAGYDPSHSPCRHQPGPEPKRAPSGSITVTIRPSSPTGRTWRGAARPWPGRRRPPLGTRSRPPWRTGRRSGAGRARGRPGRGGRCAARGGRHTSRRRGRGGWSRHGAAGT
jgi:hypothetical protein